jgi:hypothetical protein
MTSIAVSAVPFVPISHEPPPKVVAPPKVVVPLAKSAAPERVAARPQPPPPPATPAARPRSGQQAAINKMLVQYAYDQSRGSDARALTTLGRQITAAAQVLGEHVTLPHAPARPLNRTV